MKTTARRTTTTTNAPRGATPEERQSIEAWLAELDDPLTRAFDAERRARSSGGSGPVSQSETPTDAARTGDARTGGSAVPTGVERPVGRAAAREPGDVPGDGRGRLRGADVRRFAVAGNAILTVRSLRTGTRFTFRFRRPDDARPGPRGVPLFVGVLAGPDNTTQYAYLGQVWETRGGALAYEVGRRSKVGADAESQRAAAWFVAALNDPSLLDRAEVWHEGRCGRCGRRLTVPSSIASGIGPECATHFHNGG